MSDSDIRYYLARASAEERRAQATDDPVMRDAHTSFAAAYRDLIFATFLRSSPRSAAS